MDASVMNVGNGEKLGAPEFIRDIRRGKYTLDMAIAEVLSFCQIRTIPVNVWMIARTLGFDVLEARFKRRSDIISGLMFDAKNELSVGEEKAKRAIVINKECSKEVQAFTIAHEIGHFALHCSEDTDFYEAIHLTKEKKETLTEEEMEKKRLEDEADSFAAALLMPAQQFEELYRKFIGTRSVEDTIKDLMISFMVEKEAVCKRIRELGIVLPNGECV